MRLWFALALAALAALSVRASESPLIFRMPESCSFELLPKDDDSLVSRKILKRWNEFAARYVEIVQYGESWHTIFSAQDKLDGYLTTHRVLNISDVDLHRYQIYPTRLFGEVRAALDMSKKGDMDGLFEALGKIHVHLRRFYQAGFLPGYADSQSLLKYAERLSKRLDQAATTHVSARKAVQGFRVMALDMKMASLPLTLIHLFSKHQAQSGIKNLREILKDPEGLEAVVDLLPHFMDWRRGSTSKYAVQIDGVLSAVYSHYRSMDWKTLDSNQALRFKKAFNHWARARMRDWFEHVQRSVLEDPGIQRLLSDDLARLRFYELISSLSVKFRREDKSDLIPLVRAKGYLEVLSNQPPLDYLSLLSIEPGGTEFFWELLNHPFNEEQSFFRLVSVTFFYNLDERILSRLNRNAGVRDRALDRLKAYLED